MKAFQICFDTFHLHLNQMHTGHHLYLNVPHTYLEHAVCWLNALLFVFPLVLLCVCVCVLHFYLLNFLHPIVEMHSG